MNQKIKSNLVNAIRVAGNAKHFEINICEEIKLYDGEEIYCFIRSAIEEFQNILFCGDDYRYKLTSV